MRSDLLRNWVKQPPAGPNKQYLRDAEREAAIDRLGRRERVLDVGSESTVTASVPAEEVVRLDFADHASAYARDLLGDEVDDYAVTEPEDPTLPFPDGSFDGAVSVGPYDWKFLDVDALTAEVRRVLDDDGRFVLTVPTPRSPYYVSGRNRHRYYEPAEATELIAPDWSIRSIDLLFQYPSPFHSAIELLPDAGQRRFAALARRLSAELTERDLRDRASYLVFGAEPLPYEQSLEDAVDCLFRPPSEAGLWHAEDGRFVRALEYSVDDDADGVDDDADGVDDDADGVDDDADGVDGDVNAVDWTGVDDDTEWRYGPFALLGALRWRRGAQGTDRYDDRIVAALDWYRDCLDEDRHREMPRYGIGPLIAAFSLADPLFEGDYRRLAALLYDHSTDRFRLDHREDGLLVYGWAELYDIDPTPARREALESAMWRLNERLDPYRGLFVTSDDKSVRHQNQMYTLWGLSRAIEATGDTGYLSSVEQVLDATIDRRMRDDGGFLWEDAGVRRKLKRAVSRRFLEGVPFRDRGPQYWQLLFACHQTFFVSAVGHYYRAGGTRSYDPAVARAMAWIDGENGTGHDLRSLSGIGVPLRHVTTDGRIDVHGQQFLGAYEVGAHAMALALLADWEGPA